MSHPFLILFQRQTPLGPCTELEHQTPPASYVSLTQIFTVGIIYMCMCLCVCTFVTARGVYGTSSTLICILCSIDIDVCSQHYLCVCVRAIFNLYFNLQINLHYFFLSLQNIYCSVGFFLLVCFCFQFQLIYSNVVDMEYEAGKVCS